MKAIVHYSYGSPDVLQCVDIEKPTPADNEVLIKVRAAAANPLDWRVMRGGPLLFRAMVGLRRPRDPGVGRDVAGHVEAVGKNVTRFKPGDAVFGTCDAAFAEYASTHERRLAAKPPGVTFEQAAAAPIAGLTALQSLRDAGKVQPGQRLLINGAAGGVGTFAVQVGKYLNADVTGVCSTRNVDMVRSLGADHAIDYTREDFTQGAERYDLILDNVGNHPFPALKRVLKPGGKCLMAGGPSDPSRILRRVFKAFLLSLVGQPFAFFVAKINSEDLAALGELIAGGTIKPVVEKCYRLTEVPDAIRYLETEHVRGKLVMTLENN